MRPVDMDEWWVEEVREALDSADAAPASAFVDHDRVVRWLDSWGSENERESPAQDTGAPAAVEED